MKFEKNPHSLYSKESMIRHLDKSDNNTKTACCDLYGLYRSLDELSSLLGYCSESGDIMEGKLPDLLKAKESVFSAYQNLRKVYKPIAETKDIILNERK